MDQLLKSIYAAVTDDGAMGQMLRSLAEGFACDSAAYVFADRRQAVADIRVAIGPFADRAVRERYDRDFAAIDPAPAAMIQHGVGRASTTDMLFDLSASALHPFLEGFYHPIGLAGALGAPLVCNHDVVSLIAVHRRPSRPSFHAGDVLAFDRLVPHLAEMTRLRHAFFALQTDLRSFGSILDGETAAVLIVDAEAQVRHGNAAARALLARGDGLVLDRTGRLRGANPEARAALAAALHRSAEDRPIVKVPRLGRAPPYMLRAQALADASGRFAVRICDPTAQSDGIAAIADILGLTAATTRLVSALAKGADLKAYAKEAGITQHTARFHLKSAFTATGTRRQAELVRVMTMLQRDLAL